MAFQYPFTILLQQHREQWCFVYAMAYNIRNHSICAKLVIIETDSTLLVSCSIYVLSSPKCLDDGGVQPTRPDGQSCFISSLTLHERAPKMWLPAVVSKFVSSLEQTQRSQQCYVLLVYSSILLDNLLLTSVVPVIPDFLMDLHHQHLNCTVASSVVAPLNDSTEYFDHGKNRFGLFALILPFQFHFLSVSSFGQSSMDAM